MLIDTHAHLQDKNYGDKLPLILDAARTAEVDTIFCIGYDYKTSVEAVQLAQKYDQVYAVVGVHPHDAKELNAEVLAGLHKLAQEPKVVAIGETGLDFYRDLSPREQQRQAFREQIALARELKKPIVIHDRDAHQEVMDIIKQEKAGANQGIMHCFSGHLPMAIELIKAGFYISFAGPLTYKNAVKSHEAAAKIPMDRILVETDCPYLTPEPLRGKKNQPANVRLVAEKLAALRRKPLEEIGYLTSLNARKVYCIE